MEEVNDHSKFSNKLTQKLNHQLVGIPNHGSINELPHHVDLSLMHPQGWPPNGMVLHSAE